LAAHLGLTAKAAGGVTFVPASVTVPFTTEQVEAHVAKAKEGGATVHAYLCDYTGPGTDLADTLAKGCAAVTVLDHHKTGLESIAASTVPANVDTSPSVMDASGAMIAYRFFGLDKLPEGQRLRRLFEYVEDRDLWRNALPDTDVFSAGLASMNLNFDVTANPSLFDEIAALDFDEVMTKGKAAKALEVATVDAELTRRFAVRIGDTSFFAVRTNSPEYRSMLGNKLAKISDEEDGMAAIAGVLYQEKDMPAKGEIKFSLRSLRDVDTTLISKAHGGGGHMNASSFVTTLAQVDEWTV
jgi:oligoribonuclease NrnB/cAMP/cGMP phosphodiesterase (DHH superfamily)